MKQPGRIQDILDGFQKFELEDIGILFGAQLPSRLRKAELVNRLTCYLVARPQRWLNHLLEVDLQLLKQLVAAGPEVHVRQDYPDYPTVLEASGLIVTGERSDDYRDVWISREVCEIVAPHIDAALAEGERSGRFEIERVALGYLNLYGLLPYTRFIDLMMDFYEQRFGDDFDRLVALLQQSPVIKLSRCSSLSDPDEYLCSPQVEDVEELIERRSDLREPKEYKAFSYDDALEAGAGAPYFTYGLSTPEGKALVRMLRRMGYEGEELLREEHYIWLSAQYYQHGNGSADELFVAVTSQTDWFVSDAEYRRFLKIVARFANTLPRWDLKGHSSDETGLLPIAVEEDASLPPLEPDELDGEVPEWTMPHPTISPGYTDTIEKDGQIRDLSAFLPEGFPFGMAIPHVAPGDPCPCGSGLKYRHCHGKYLS